MGLGQCFPTFRHFWNTFTILTGLWPAHTSIDFIYLNHFGLNLLYKYIYIFVYIYTIAINIKSVIVTLNRKYYVITAKLFNSRWITWLAVFLRPFCSFFRKNRANVGKVLGMTPNWESLQKDIKRIFKSITFSQSHTISSRLPRHLGNAETRQSDFVRITKPAKELGRGSRKQERFPS